MLKIVISNLWIPFFSFHDSTRTKFNFTMIPKIMSYFGLNSLGTLLGIGGKFYGNVHSRVEHLPLEIEGVISILTRHLPNAQI